MEHQPKQTILLVEDEEQQREVLSTILELEGFTVLGAESTEAALHLLANTTPALIVTDIKLPGLDGLAFFDIVRESPGCSTTPFVFITGYNEPEAIERVKKLGAAGYITKPYDVSNLLGLIKQIASPNPGTQ